MIYNRGTLSKETIRSIKEVYGTTTINLKQNDSFRLSIMGNSQTGIWCISEANAMTVQLEFSTGRVGEISTYHTSKDSWSIHLNDVSLVMHREKE
ncbi:MAG: hypothetical protein COA58_06660 [Bacteroidetes bacterium]|nr:MAG: hypothetical protein COA58_06660 [Bacteroidota bacterium]